MKNTLTSVFTHFIRAIGGEVSAGELPSTLQGHCDLRQRASIWSPGAPGERLRIEPAGVDEAVHLEVFIAQPSPPHRPVPWRREEPGRDPPY